MAVAKGDGSERTPLGTAGRRGAVGGLEVGGLEGGCEEDEEKNKKGDCRELAASSAMEKTRKEAKKMD